MMDWKTVLQDAGGKTCPAVLLMQQVRLKNLPSDSTALRFYFFIFFFCSVFHMVTSLISTACILIFLCQSCHTILFKNRIILYLQTKNALQDTKISEK